MSYNSSCGNCEFHGSPCLNCAEYYHEGLLGPGYYLKTRYMIKNLTEPDIYEVMLKWCNDRTNTTPVVFIDDYVELPSY